MLGLVPGIADAEAVRQASADPASSAESGAVLEIGGHKLPCGVSYIEGKLSCVALLWNPDNPWHPETVGALQRRGGSMGLQLQDLDVRGPEAFDGAFRAMTAEGAQAILLLTDPMTIFHRRRLADLAIQRRLPMMGGVAAYAEAGCLMSYWADTTDTYRRAASYVDRLLKGAKPGDLPIEQPTKFELVANLKTAKALGITIPPSILLRTHRVIE